ncbi:hypothetical protein CICLE_v10013240mg [Citrus x clementina]|uniref:Uncharacterized protein n=1 Tax=Citrus clementina TaxID=85681 RepID=V4UW99_CITCL|nr:hypothetical protein CICLE_v10013240mg [Citrus x clementina]
MASKASTQHINLKLSEIPIQLTILTVKHQRQEVSWHHLRKGKGSFSEGFKLQFQTFQSPGRFHQKNIKLLNNGFTLNPNF